MITNINNIYFFIAIIELSLLRLNYIYITNIYGS